MLYFWYSVIFDYFCNDFIVDLFTENKEIVIIRDINLYFVYNRQYQQWFSSGPEFFNEAICEKVKNKNFNLKAFARQYYHVEKNRNGYAISHLDQKKALGNRESLVPIIFDKTDI